MKVFILEDMEGISGTGCAVRLSETDLLHGDVNAAIAGAKAAGATEIVVGDWHAFGGNLSANKLLQPVRLTQWDDRRVLQTEKFDMAFIIGAHARAGLPAIMAHTVEYFIQNVFVNGRVVGEAPLLYYYLTDLGIPVGVISGAGEALDEVRTLAKGTELVEVKRGFKCQPVSESQQHIMRTIRQAIEKKQAKLIQSKERELAVEYSSSRIAAEHAKHPHATLVNLHSIQISGKNLGNCFETLMQLCAGRE